MFRIGEFSRIARVTIETLRHYDALGLLKPLHIDPTTGYRYYAARQLKTLTRILALKESGFSLDEIARILQEKLSNDEIRGMLKTQLVLAEREILSAQARQEQIINRLNHLDLEECMPAYEVILKPVDPLTIAAIRETISSVDQMPARCGAMFQQIGQWLVSNRLPFGPTLTIYYNEGYTTENIDTECAFVILDPATAQTAQPVPPIAIRTLSGAPSVASTIVSDDFFQKPGGLTPAYHAIARWIDENGYRIIGPAREIYYGSPQSGDFTAEVQFPVEKAL